MLCSENANLVGGGSYILCLDALSVVQHTNRLRPHQGSPFSQPTSKSWISVSLWPEQDVTMALSNICSAGKRCGLVWNGNTSFVYGEQLNLYVCMHFSQHLTCKFDMMHYLWNLIRRTHMDRVYESQAEPQHKCGLWRKCRCIMREICFLPGVTSIMHFIMERITVIVMMKLQRPDWVRSWDIREDISWGLSVFVFCTQTLIFCRLDFKTPARKWPADTNCI